MSQSDPDPIACVAGCKRAVADEAAAMRCRLVVPADPRALAVHRVLARAACRQSPEGEPMSAADKRMFHFGKTKDIDWSLVR